jgi:hypothetical protein
LCRNAKKVINASTKPIEHSAAASISIHTSQDGMVHESYNVEPKLPIVEAIAFASHAAVTVPAAAMAVM